MVPPKKTNRKRGDRLTDLIQDVADVRAPAVPQMAASRTGPLSFRTKAIYGSGSLVETVINAALTNFHLFYLTAVCGLSGTLAGASGFAALAIDAFFDPFMGYLSDGTHSRFGRRHPYMIVAAVPIAITFGLLFSIPSGFKGFGLFLYSTSIVLAMRIGLSAFVVPFMAMGGELTDDYHERSIVVTYRHFFGIIGGIIPVLIGLPLFLSGNNMLLRGAYIPYVWTCAAVVLGGALFSSLGSLDTVPRLHQAKTEASRNIGRDFLEVFKNKSFVVLFVALLIFFIAQGTAGVLALHASKYFWRLPTANIASIQILYPIGQALGIPIILAFATRLEKRTITLGGQIAFCALQAGLPLLRIAGLLPPNGPLLYAMITANWIIVGVSVTAMVIGFQSMMADAADEHDYLFGARREGVYFAGLSFSVKLTAGVGVLIGGIALDAIGFPSGWIAAHPLATVHLADLTVRNLGLVAGPMPAAITAICILVTWFYRIDRKRHAEITETLNARRAAAAKQQP